MVMAAVSRKICLAVYLSNANWLENGRTMTAAIFKTAAMDLFLRCQPFQSASLPFKWHESERPREVDHPSFGVRPGGAESIPLPPPCWTSPPRWTSRPYLASRSTGNGDIGPTMHDYTRLWYPLAEAATSRLRDRGWVFINKKKLISFSLAARITKTR